MNLSSVLKIHASGGCILGPAFVQAGLRGAGSDFTERDLDLCPPNGATTDTVLAIPVEATVGEPFRMTYHVEARIPDSPSTMRGIHSFEDPSGGALTVSCNRSVQRSMRIEPAGWGRLRSIYR